MSWNWGLRLDLYQKIEGKSSRKSILSFSIISFGFIIPAIWKVGNIVPYRFQIWPDYGPNIIPFPKFVAQNGDYEQHIIVRKDHCVPWLRTKMSLAWSHGSASHCTAIASILRRNIRRKKRHKIKRETMANGAEVRRQQNKNFQKHR